MIKVQIILTIEDFEEGVECPRNSFWVIHPPFCLFWTENQHIRQPRPQGLLAFNTSTFPIMHLICYPRTPSKKKVCISIVFSFSWDGCNTQEKWKTKVMQIFFWVGGGADKVRYGKCGSGVLPLGCATGRPCNNRRLEHVHHANVVVFFRWKSWSCMCFDSQNNLRLWSSPNNKAVGFMDETFGFVEETVAFWDISIVLQNFALS